MISPVFFFLRIVMWSFIVSKFTFCLMLVLLNLTFSCDFYFPATLYFRYSCCWMQRFSVGLPWKSIPSLVFWKHLLKWVMALLKVWLNVWKSFWGSVVWILWIRCLCLLVYAVDIWSGWIVCKLWFLTLGFYLLLFVGWVKSNCHCWVCWVCCELGAMLLPLLIREG